MGLTILTLDVAAPHDPTRREAVDFLVDSGTIYSFVPRPVLEGLGITAHGRQRFRRADGSTIEHDRALLGAVTLDAIRRDLVRLPMIVAGAAAA
jgi:hypothetical protein